MNTHTAPIVLDLFAGPGGWDTGLRATGYTGPLIGVEHDADACATARAAGHTRHHGDVPALDPTTFGPVAGLIASPPCQTYSTAGDRQGALDIAAVVALMSAHLRGRAIDDGYAWADERSKLTAEPARYVAALRPLWVACEQVPAVLPLWEHFAALLREQGYRAWCGILSAERYGVPQTRRRAFLIARRDTGRVGPPEPTHQAYRADQQTAEPSLFGDPLPAPVSMLDALGWGLPERPAWTVTGGGTATGGEEVFGNYAARQQLAALAPAGVASTMVTPRPVSEPAHTITGAGSAEFVLRSNYTVGGDLDTRAERELTEPATTITSKVGQWAMRNGNQTNACTRDLTEPAGTVYFGNRANAVEFLDLDGHGRRRVSIAEAGVLQGFPADYPWQGTKTARYRQIGDAVPPPIAAAILHTLTAMPERTEAAA